MPRVDRSPTSSVRQLCKWFESPNEHHRSSSACPNPVRMDHNARISAVEDIRTKFLNNLQMFEQHQTALAQSGPVFRGSSPSLHQTAHIPLHQTAHIPLAYLPSRTTALSVDLSQSRFSSESVSPTLGYDCSEKGSSRSRSSETNPCSSHCREMNFSVSPSDDSKNMSWSQISGNVPVSSSDKLKVVKSTSCDSRTRSHCPPNSSHAHHQPVIRERREEDERGGRGQSSHKSPLLRVLSSQSVSWLHTAGVKKSALRGTTASGHKHFHVQDRVDGHLQSCPHPGSVSRRRQSVADPQDVLQPQHPKRCHRSDDVTGEVPSPSRHSRMVSTASIQLRKLSLPVSRKRSSSEERRISVIHTASKRFPETLTKPFPMLDEWLSSLVKQQPSEVMDCDEESLPSPRQQQQQQLYCSMCSEHSSWHYPRKCSSCQQTSRRSGKDGVGRRTSEPRDTSVDEMSGASSRYADHGSYRYVHHQNNIPDSMCGELSHRGRRTFKDNNIQVKKCERRSSEERLSRQSSVTGAGIPIPATEEDEDSACVQSVSDSASVQLCVPIGEDPSTTPTNTASTSLRQHRPLSPCSSLGSYHSAMSSNADSAVDMALPDDEALEMDVSQLDCATKLKQLLLARSHCTSSPSSSFCQTVTCSSSSSSSQNVTHSSSSCCQTVTYSSTSTSSSSSVQVLTSDPSRPSTISLKLDLPSFLISDHSSSSKVPGAEEEEEEYPRNYLDLMDVSGGVLEPGYLPRSPSATSSSSEGSFCSTCWTDSSVSDAELPARKPERRRKLG
ncbi:hypothetical protein ACOMHN_032994 [Nucella lapillus]